MTSQASTRKEPYQKPEVRIIELKAEETLSVGCKTFPGSTAGAGGSGCGNAICALPIGS